MEYRNSGVNTHFGGGLVAGVDRNAATEILGSTISVASDSNNAGLTITAKGTGTLTLGDSSNVVTLNGSTVALKMVAGVSSYRLPDLSSFAQGVCTLAAAGISTGDLIVAFDFRFSSGAGSTSYIYAGVTPSAANEITVAVANVHNSSVSGSSGRVRWAYIDRT